MAKKKKDSSPINKILFEEILGRIANVLKETVERNIKKDRQRKRAYIKCQF